MTEKVSGITYKTIPYQVTLQVEKSAFASDSAIREMMKEMEDIYALAFGACIQP